MNDVSRQRVPVVDNSVRIKIKIVRSPDTDVLIILVSYSNEIVQPLLFDTGTGNKRRLLAIATSRGLEIAKALPGFHAFTGSDSTSAFIRKGKIQPFKALVSRIQERSE